MFGLHYLATKVLLGFVEPSAWAALRMLSAAVIFLAVWLMSRPAAIDARDLLRLAGLSIFGVLLNQVCFIEGLARTTPAHSSLLMTTIPVATLGFAVLLGRERLRWPAVAGILLSMAGVLLLLRIDDLELRSEWFVGDVLTLINGASFAFFLVISKDVVRRVGPVAATAGILCFGSLGATLYGGAAVARTDFGAWTAAHWWLAAGIVIFPTVLAYFLNFWALARVQSSHVALFIYLQPILAASLSVLLLGEIITERLVASSALVFLGVLFATQALGREPAPAVEPI
jgi:drug/metabolite transporter (DMT)-like permease